MVWSETTDLSNPSATLYLYLVDHEEHIVEANKLMDKAEATAVQAKALMEDAEATVNQAQTEVEEAAKKLAQEDKPALAAAVDSLSEKIGDVKEDIQESIQDMKKLISDFVPDEVGAIDNCSEVISLGTVSDLRPSNRRDLPQKIEDNVIYVAKSVNYLFSDFIAFINRGNVLDLAVGVIIGAGFTGIVNAVGSSTSFVSFLSSISLSRFHPFRKQIRRSTISSPRSSPTSPKTVPP